MILAILEKKSIIFDFNSIEIIGKYETVENKENLGSLSHEGIN